MPYRRPPQNTKRFLPPLPFNFTPGRNTASAYSNTENHKDYLDIPLPNELEYANSSPGERGLLSGFSSVVGFVKEHIHIEELILIGLIILLLEESRADDNILLILLFYILIF